MRILLVMGSYYPELHFGGSTQKLYELSLGLVARGHEVEVLTFHSDKALGGTRTTTQGVKVQYLPWIGKGSWRVPLKLSLLRKAVAESDAVHCFGLYSLLCAAAASTAQRQQRPYLIEPLGMYVPRGRQLLAKRLYNHAFTKWMLSGAAAVIVTSQTEYDELSDAVSESQLYLRRDGIRPEFLQACSDGDGFRNQFEIDASERVILFLGRISRIKNLEQLIMAFKSACIENSRLVLVGPSDEPDYQLKLKRIIDEERLGRKVIFTGPLYEHQKLPAFAAADLFVLPSHYESYGLAAAEAAAAGVPVLITKNCGIAPLIDGRAGLAVRAEVEELSKGMRTLLCDDSERERVTALRSEVLKDLTWDKPLDQLEAIYRKSAIDLSTRQISPQFS